MNYLDNKWHDGRRGQDGWGRYTRRRKWYRDAELVEIEQNVDLDGSTRTLRAPSTPKKPSDAASHVSSSSKDLDELSGGVAKRRGFFKRRNSGKSTQSSSDFSATTTLRNDDDDHHLVPPQHERNGDWDVGDDVKMGLG